MFDSTIRANLLLARPDATESELRLALRRARLEEWVASLPEGLDYVDSWVEANFSRCFQLMRCDDLKLIQAWIVGWRGCGVTFEIVPVVMSAEARGVVEPYLEPPPSEPAPEG